MTTRSSPRHRAGTTSNTTSNINTSRRSTTSGDGSIPPAPTNTGDTTSTSNNSVHDHQSYYTVSPDTRPVGYRRKKNTNTCDSYFTSVTLKQHTISQQQSSAKNVSLVEQENSTRSSSNEVASLRMSVGDCWTFAAHTTIATTTTTNIKDGSNGNNTSSSVSPSSSERDPNAVYKQYPFPHVPWKVGLVLTLFSRTTAINRPIIASTSTTTATSTTSSIPADTTTTSTNGTAISQYYAQVLWLYHFRTQKKYLKQLGLLKKFTNVLRPECSLLETDQVDIIPLEQSFLPGRVTIEPPWSDGRVKTVIPMHDITNSDGNMVYYKLVYSCPRQLPVATSTQKGCINHSDNVNNPPRIELVPASDFLPPNQKEPPPILKRGWSYLSKPCPVGQWAKCFNHSTISSDPVIPSKQVVEKLSMDQKQSKDSSTAVSSSSTRKRVVSTTKTATRPSKRTKNSIHIELAGEKENLAHTRNTNVKSFTKGSTETMEGQDSRKRPSYTRNNTEIIESSGGVMKRHYPTKKIPSQQMKQVSFQTESDIDESSNKNSNKRGRENAVRWNSETENTTGWTEQKAVSTDTTSSSWWWAAPDTVIEPLSSVMHTLKPTKTRPETYSFYASLMFQPPIPDTFLSVIKTAGRRKNGKSPPIALTPWSVSVGDTLAVQCSADTCSLKRFTPFHHPWSAVQVLSLFQRTAVEPLSSTNTAVEPESSDAVSLKKAPPCSSSYFMEVRWFHRVDELEDEIKDNIPPEQLKELALDRHFVVEMDEDVTIIPVQAALGRVAISSDQMGVYGSISSEAGKVPASQQLICYQLYQMRYDHPQQGLDRIMDWTGHKSRMAGPLSRALLCEKGWPGKLPRLRKQYEFFLRKKYGLTDQMCTNIPDHEYLNNDKFQRQWPDEILGLSIPPSMVYIDKQTHILHSQSLGQEQSRMFYDSINIPVVAKLCDPRATAKKSFAPLQTWTVKLGDIVCVMVTDILPFPLLPSNRDGVRNPWYPFLGPWRAGQVLSVYHDGNDSEADMYLEIRWFIRPTELPSSLQQRKPPELTQLTKHDKNASEMYETDMIDSKIPARYVLGVVDVHMAHIPTSCPSNSTTDSSTPVTTCRIRYFYSSLYKRLQPLFCSDSNPQAWLRDLKRRGFILSPLIQQHVMLRRKVLAIGDDCHNLNSSFKVPDALQVPSLASNQNFARQLEMTQNSNHKLFVSVSLSPQWTKHSLTGLLVSEQDQSSLRWTVSVGDVVAIQNSQAQPLESETFYPFTVPWKAVQVLAIYTDETMSYGDNQMPLMFQVRSFVRESELHDSMPSSLEAWFDALYETDEVDEKGIDSSMLLGPVSLLPAYGNTGHWMSNLWQKAVPFLPAIDLVYAGSRKTKTETDRSEAEDCGKRLLDLVKNGINLSAHYGRDDKQKLLDALQQEAGKADCSVVGRQLPMDEFIAENSQLVTLGIPPSGASTAPAHIINTARNGRQDRARISVDPFHIDYGTGYKYFDQIEVTPPYENYEVKCHSDLDDCTSAWTVRLGDVVILHYNTCCGRTSYRTAMIKPYQSRYFPMSQDVPWGVGEVVTIRTDIKDRSEIKLEIRWFYRARELMSSLPDNYNTPDDGDQCEEIFESDHYDECSASSLLAPVLLHATTQPASDAVHLGMPVVGFVCCRYWSVHRHCVVPTGDLNKRTERGRALSKYFGSNAPLKAAYDLTVNSSQASTALSTLVHDSTSWKDVFKQVINKLSLADASKEAAENGAVLIGRDDERATLRSFLHRAIAGNVEASNKPSLFVAGPPGVGKTASVRAVIRELQNEQAAGRLIPFQFIALNGMEMRSPLDTYVRLWEGISDEKSSVSPEAAVIKLEDYLFTKKEGAKTLKRTVVVLVDEIDYLYTKKQTVLYNLFDWPVRTVERGTGTRLVVIGVSNTLNLPERLHPRIQSRIGPKRVFFSAYKADEIGAILRYKINQAAPNYAVFDDDAIILASKRIAARSGDIRKAFQICRTAAQMVLTNCETNSNHTFTHNGGQPQVRMNDVLKVTRDSFNSAMSRTVATCATFEVLLLIALSSLSKCTGRETGGFDIDELRMKMDSIANSSGDPMYQPSPNLPETLDLLGRLGEMRLVELHHHHYHAAGSTSISSGIMMMGGPWPIASPVMDGITIIVALQGTKHHQVALKHL